MNARAAGLVLGTLVALGMVASGCSREGFARAMMAHGESSPPFHFETDVPSFASDVCSKATDAEFADAWQRFQRTSTKPTAKTIAGRVELCKQVRAFAAASPDPHPIHDRIITFFDVGPVSRGLYFRVGAGFLPPRLHGNPRGFDPDFDARDPYWSSPTRIAAAVAHRFSHDRRDTILFEGRREGVFYRFYVETAAIIVSRMIVPSATDAELLAMTDEELGQARAAIRDAARESRSANPDELEIFGGTAENPPEKRAGYVIALEIAKTIIARDGFPKAAWVQPPGFFPWLERSLTDLAGPPRPPTARPPLPDSLACVAPPPSTRTAPPSPPRPKGDAAIAGQMSEAATEAKQLFDAERWTAATLGLREVAEGRTRDDAGNRELAQYHLAIALFRTKRFDESQRVFGAIARDRSHLKFRETLLWLAKHEDERPASFVVADLASYELADLQPLDNTNQRVLYGQLAYLLGRQRYSEGRTDDAFALFKLVPAESAWSAPAGQCLGRLYRR